MKPILLIILLLTNTYLPAQQRAAISVADWQSDFDLLRKSLEEAHGGLYRFSTKQQMDARFDAARKKIPSIKNRKEYLGLLYELVATTRDGHLRFDIDPDTRAAVDKADGFIETGNQRRLERTFPQFYWLTIGEDSTFTVSLKDAGGKTINAKLQGIVNSEREKNRNSNSVNATIIKNITSLDGPQDNITLRFPGNDIACIRIRGFQGQTYNQQIDSVFKIANDKKTKALILDLRNNGGGADLYGAYLVSQFVTKPFRYFDRIHLRTLTPSFTTFTENTVRDLKNGTVADPKGGFLVTPKLHAGVGEQQPAAQPFTGKTFVLINGSTFSTAADVCALMRHLTKAVFIGEETGGGFEGNTSGLNASLRLPYSKLGIRVQMYEYWNAVNVVERGRGTIPEHHMPKRITDLLQGTDARINRAVELANTK